MRVDECDEYCIPGELKQAAHGAISKKKKKEKNGDCLKACPTIKSQINVHMRRMRHTDGRGVCKSKDSANTPGNYIRQLSLEKFSLVQHMTGVAYLGSK